MMRGDEKVWVGLVDVRVVAVEEGGAVVELGHQDGVGAGDKVGGEAGKEEKVHGEDAEKAFSSKLHPFVSHQSQAERVPVKKNRNNSLL